MKKEKIVIKFVCLKCNWENEPTKESNKNWEVINPVCDRCGTKLTIKLLCV